MAATRKRSTRKTQPASLEANPRHLWLASLGLLVAARREGRAAALRALGQVETAANQARAAARQAEAELRAGVEGVRDQVAPKVACIGNEVAARLAPIVAKLGLKPMEGEEPMRAVEAAE